MDAENIKSGERILAIIVKTGEIEDKVKFVSPESFPFQVGIQNRKKGDCVEAHEHLSFEKLENFPVQEFFYVESGKIEVGIYDEDKKVAVRILSKGDLIILNSGHEVRFLEDSKIIEIKQGPYRGKENEKRYLKKVEEKAGRKNDSSM